MTPTEFKAWFEGFTEAMDGHPTEAQWAKVKQRVSQIDGKPTTYTVFMDRWWPGGYPRWSDAPYTPYRVVGNAAGADTVTGPFDSLSAMKALGATDYSAT